MGRRFFGLGWFVLMLLSRPSVAIDSFVCDCGPGADVDCVAGSDGAAGTTMSPWQTYERARSAFATISPGDSIRFCRGGSFTPIASTRWVNGSCQAAQPCLVSDYAPSWASGDEGRPVIQALAGSNGFSLEDGGNADHEEGYVFENLVVLGGGGGGWAFFFYNDIDDVEIRNVHLEGFDIGVHLAGSNPCSSDPLCDGQNDRVVLRDSTIVNNAAQGWLGSSDGAQILNNDFEGNGAATVFDHNIYLSGSSGGQTQGVRIIGNQLYRSSQGSGGSCVGTSLVVHGQHRDLVIEGNLVWEDVGTAGPGCWGIAVDSGYASAEGFDAVTIRGNLVRNVGNVAIGINSTVDGVIENNVIIQENGFGFRAIAAPNRAPGPGDQTLDRMTVRNNSIWIATSPGEAIAVGGSGSGHIVVSNAIHYLGGTPFACLDLNLATSAYAAVDNNVCWFPNAAGSQWTLGYGTTPTPLGAWQSTGFGSASQYADPGFTAPAIGDLTPLAGASVVDAGHPSLSSTLDFAATTRDAMPDVGAYEWAGCAVTPGRVDGLAMVEPVSAAATVAWNADPIAGGYRLYRVDDKSLIATANGPLIPTCDVATTSCVVSPLAAGYFQLVAVCAGDATVEGPH